MNVGDLVTFTPEKWGGDPLKPPLGVITHVGGESTGPIAFQMVTVQFTRGGNPFSSSIESFKVVNENR